LIRLIVIVFFFHSPATALIFTLSLHDALPICIVPGVVRRSWPGTGHWAFPAPQHRVNRSDRFRKAPFLDTLKGTGPFRAPRVKEDRKSTRLNSSHVAISYAVFCLKKKTIRKKK